MSPVPFTQQTVFFLVNVLSALVESQVPASMWICAWVSGLILVISVFWCQPRVLLHQLLWCLQLVLAPRIAVVSPDLLWHPVHFRIAFSISVESVIGISHALIFLVIIISGVFLTSASLFRNTAEFCVLVCVFGHLTLLFIYPKSIFMVGGSLDFSLHKSCYQQIGVIQFSI